MNPKMFLAPIAALVFAFASFGAWASDEAEPATAEEEAACVDDEATEVDECAEMAENEEAKS